MNISDLRQDEQRGEPAHSGQCYEQLDPRIGLGDLRQVLIQPVDDRLECVDRLQHVGRDHQGGGRRRQLLQPLPAGAVQQLEHRSQP
ncbi:hypothetical protein NGM37_56390 [Streptomyces sp. TRM76130]|nr:hypothetical protein [Streptomyces sp. TRM76130]